MTDEWCVYTGKTYPKEEMTDDHVIPLSLGGHDGFTIRSSREGNEHVNRLLDEPIARHPFVANMRRLRKLAGRRGKVPVVRWPGTVGGVPAVVAWSKPEIEVETFRGSAPHALNTKRLANEGERFQAKIKFSGDQFLSFGCRLALGSAQHFFGPTFQRYGYHNELRQLMNDPQSVRTLNFKVANATGRGFFWALSWPRTAEKLEPLWPALSKRSKDHLVFTEHMRNELILGVSLFGGFFQWYFNITNETEKFPSGGAFELGAVIEVGLNPPSLKRTDLRTHLEAFQKETVRVRLR